MIRKLSLPAISNSEDSYEPSCVLVLARALPHPPSGAAVASLLEPVLATWDIRSE
jgi:hypothetical protein